jgi:hypothetical protein
VYEFEGKKSRETKKKKYTDFKSSGYHSVSGWFWKGGWDLWAQERRFLFEGTSFSFFLPFFSTAKLRDFLILFYLNLIWMSFGLMGLCRIPKFWNLLVYKWWLWDFGNWISEIPGFSIKFFTKWEGKSSQGMQTTRTLPELTTALKVSKRLGDLKGVRWRIDLGILHINWDI